MLSGLLTGSWYTNWDSSPSYPSILWNHSITQDAHSQLPPSQMSVLFPLLPRANLLAQLFLSLSHTDPQFPFVTRERTPQWGVICIADTWEQSSVGAVCVTPGTHRGIWLQPACSWGILAESSWEACIYTQPTGWLLSFDTQDHTQLGLPICRGTFPGLLSTLSNTGR